MQNNAISLLQKLTTKNNSEIILKTNICDFSSFSSQNRITNELQISEKYIIDWFQICKYHSSLSCKLRYCIWMDQINQNFTVLLNEY